MTSRSGTSSVKCLVLVTSLAVGSWLLIQSVDSCNEAICASVVSKCLLTQSCKCDLKNCTCCKDCFTCLNYLYDECCSCVEMCPKPNDTSSELSRRSHVEELPEPVPELFTVLTEEPDSHVRWTTFTFPVDLDLAFMGHKYDKEIKYKAITAEQEVVPLKDLVTVNCTVAYMSQCMSWNKCKASCRSMGSSSYRWFHDGCCECVGYTCINYGINDSRCLECPLDEEGEGEDDIDSEDITDLLYDYEYEEGKTNNGQKKEPPKKE